VVDLVMHRFDFDTDPLMFAYYLPGGEFLVFLHVNGSISLKRIKESVETDEWKLCDVARYDRREEEGRPAFPSETLNEISYGRFVLGYTVEGDLDRYAHRCSNIHRPLTMELRIFIFCIDNVSRVIEEGPVVQINHIDVQYEDFFEVITSVWTVKNAIFHFREYHSLREPKHSGLVVAHLGEEVVQRHFWLVTPTVWWTFSVLLAPLTPSSENK